MDPVTKSLLTNKIGNFTLGKTNWLEFEARMEDCFEEKNVITPHFKKEVILDVIGGKTMRILKGIIKPLDIQDVEVDYDMITKTLETYFYPNPNRSFYITKFFLRKQKRGETFFQFVLNLRKLMLKCSFGKGQHIKLRKQILQGVVPRLKEKFTNSSSIPLSEIFEIGLLWDKKQAGIVDRHPRNHKARKNKTPTCFRCSMSISKEHSGEPCPFEWSTCYGCGVRGHLSIACKYKEFICHNCKKQGHVAKLCKEKKTNNKSEITSTT
nr:uncharacterized protein LOC111511868 [Leptinotarsa decemlineata]